MLLPSFNDSNESFHLGGSLVSPPTSPPPSHTSPSTTISSIFSTCRALQSMLTAPTQLPTPFNSPPLLNSPAPSSNPKFRLSRSRKIIGDSNHQTSLPRMKMRVTKRPAPIPRGVNKRRRDTNDDGQKDQLSNVHNEVDEEYEKEKDEWKREGDENEGSMLDCPSTPKRSRIAPEVVPFGLARSDFHDLHLKSMPVRLTPRQSMISAISPSAAFTFTYPIRSSPPVMSDHDLSKSFMPSTTKSAVSLTSSPLRPASFTSENIREPAAAAAQTDLTGSDNNTPEEEEWCPEDDKILVEVILEKLRISKADLEDCARSLGRDRHSVSRRWKSLKSAGEIGLKNSGGSKRSSIYGSWRWLFIFFTIRLVWSGICLPAFEDKKTACIHYSFDTFVSFVIQTSNSNGSSGVHRSYFSLSFSSTHTHNSNARHTLLSHEQTRELLLNMNDTFLRLLRTGLV